MASSSSAQNPRHLLNHLYGGPTSAPPPTPSTVQPSLSSTTPDSAAADALSRLLHRLPPNLSLPTRRRPSPLSVKPTPLPTLTLSSTSPPSSISTLELGYFQLTHHSITPQLAESAESDSLALFDSPLDVKLSAFPNDWPFGFHNDDDDDDGDDGGGDHQMASFCLDGSQLSTTTTETTELKLASLSELTRELEKVGLDVAERVACAVGFENPFKEGGAGPKHCSMMWVSSSDGNKPGKVYPYVVGLQYQIRPRKWDLLSDSGSVNVEPQVGSVLVMLGDIVQVWSNGKLNKVRGRPAPVSEDGNPSLPCISMTLLLTLPLESTVSPLLIVPNNKSMDNNRDKEACGPEKDKAGNNDDDHQSIEPSMSSDGNKDNANEDQRVFNSFSFEDYAWRVYHERLLFKDPLDRYRVID